MKASGMFRSLFFCQYGPERMPRRPRAAEAGSRRTLEFPLML
jgi:hypothetical protein